MFDSVSKKLEMARYFLDNLKSLAEEAGGFAYIQSSKRIETDANLDGFFFELISAKDFFLQEINDKYEAEVPGKCPNMEKALLNADVLPEHVKSQVMRIKGLLSDPNSWLWRLNNYRNCATHRQLIHRYYTANLPTKEVKSYLLRDPDEPSSGPLDMEIIPYCEKSLEQMTDFLEQL